MACQMEPSCLIKYFLAHKIIAGVSDLYNEVIFTTTYFKLLYNDSKILAILYVVNL